MIYRIIGCMKVTCIRPVFTGGTERTQELREPNNIQVLFDLVNPWLN